MRELEGWDGTCKSERAFVDIAGPLQVGHNTFTTSITSGALP